MRVDPKRCPVAQFLFNDLPRRFRHQAQRIAREIDDRLAVFAERQIKFVAEIAMWIVGIQSQRFVGGELHGLTVKPAALASFLWRWSNERKMFARASSA